MILDEPINAKRLVEYLLDQPWHKHCELAREEKRLVLKFNNGKEYPPYLRFSGGAKQGFFWDVYGDDLVNTELAVIALSEAPAPVDVSPVTFTIKLNTNK